MDRLLIIEGRSPGLSDAEFAAHGGNTHVVVPLRVVSSNPTTAVALATLAGQLATDAALMIPGVQSIGDPVEGCYALLFNLNTAIQALDERGQQMVMAAAKQAGMLQPLAGMLAKAVVTDG